MIGKILGAGLLTGLGLAIYARYIEPKRIEVTDIDLGGDLTVALVTDIHINPHFHATDLAPTIRQLERIQPDVILFGGDFISESPRFLRELEAPLRQMAATARIGSWGVWGNHDIANIRARVAPVLANSGITMLTNEVAHLAGDLWVVGIDDALLGTPEIAATFAQVPDGARVIALWHEPDWAEKVAPFNPQIMLSGHTHGGQMRLPIIGPLATPLLGKRHVAGHYNIDGMPLYVSRGIGMYRPPLRLHSRPEIVLIHI
ncbi:MAG: metallophosphoesterase [Thermomicrobiales bacterium]|nr:metallophosphoesterase [Thermomicrobiales bacterium]